jgi:hypothetical protein
MAVLRTASSSASPAAWVGSSAADQSRGRPAASKCATRLRRRSGLRSFPQTALPRSADPASAPPPPSSSARFLFPRVLDSRTRSTARLGALTFVAIATVVAATNVTLSFFVAIGTAKPSASRMACLPTTIGIHLAQPVSEYCQSFCTHPGRLIKVGFDTPCCCAARQDFRSRQLTNQKPGGNNGE